MATGSMEQDKPGKPKRGELIVVCGAKGGSGKTVIAVNLAVALSKNNIQICVLDGDFQFGDVCLAMDLRPTFTIKDAIQGAGKMDAYTLASCLIKHTSGVKVLAAPDRPEYADLITTSVIDSVCELLLAQHDYLIIDTAAGLQEQAIQLMERADQLFVVTTLEMSAIKNTKLMLETFALLGLRDKVRLIVNRSTMDSVIKASDVPDILDEESPFYIPNDFAVVSGSLNLGMPFVQSQGKTDISKAMFKMAEQLVSRREIALFKPQPPSILQLLFAKSKGGKEKSE